MGSQKQLVAGRRGIALLVVAGMSVVILAMTGMSIDVGILYVVRTKLSAAADAAVLAGARSLSNGLSNDLQTAAATTATQNYFTANFPGSYFVTSAPTIATTVAFPALALRTVTTTATATVPTYFLRILPSLPATVTVTVTAQAQRRDTNMILVMDRSGSLANSGSCTPMIASATGFVNMFADGHDTLGMVTFASSSYYDYPLTQSFKTGTPSLATQIGKITCVGGTSSAMGLWNGYAALANTAAPGALNVIIFFTDGDPTAFTATFPVKSSSACTNFGTSPKAHLNIYGVLTEGGSPFGLLDPAISGLPVNGTLESQEEPQDDSATTPNATTNCGFVGSGNPNPSNDISGTIPLTDYFGDTLNSGYMSPVSVTSSIGIDNASINAADQAATHIRNGDPVIKVTPGSTIPAGAVGKSLAGVVIFSIGLGTATVPPTASFLERVANDPRSAVYDSTKTAGLYIFAQTASDLNQAFQEVATQVLRLSQ